jgi:hypothetical protein
MQIIPHTECRAYYDDRKTIALFRTTFVTVCAIEELASDKSQSGCVFITVFCSATFKLQLLEKTNPIENGQFWPNGLLKSLKFPYLLGFITSLFMLS